MLTFHLLSCTKELPAGKFVVQGSSGTIEIWTAAMCPASLEACIKNRLILRLLWAGSLFLNFPRSALRVAQSPENVRKDLLCCVCHSGLFVRKGDPHPGIWDLREHYSQGEDDSGQMEAEQIKRPGWS